MENEPRYLIPEHRRPGLVYICVDNLIWGYAKTQGGIENMVLLARARYSFVTKHIMPPSWQMHPDSPNNTLQFTRSYE